MGSGRGPPGHSVLGLKGFTIVAHRLRTPDGEIDLVAPTWVTLHHLSLYENSADILAKFNANPHRIYETHLATTSDGVSVAMWDGDAGYADTNPDAQGARHRLLMPEDGFIFENTVIDY